MSQRNIDRLIDRLIGDKTRTTVLKYKTNLNCGSCVAAVKPHLDGDASIERWSVDTNDPNKVLTVAGEKLSEPEIKRHVADAGFKVLGEVAPEAPVSEAEKKSFWQTYRPLLLVVGYLVGIVGLVEITAGSFEWMRAMGNFMGGFFLAFSFFNLPMSKVTFIEDGVMAAMAAAMLWGLFI
jgi:copper chaperone CopZ